MEIKENVKRYGATQEKFPYYMEDQRQFFDELITNDWESYLDPRWNAVRQFEVDKIFKIISPKRILNIGCGCGYHDVLMAEKPCVEQVVAIDYSEKSIEKANEVYPHYKVTRMAVDFFKLPPGEFDLAVSFQVIEHLPDARAFLYACAKQVHSGGWVVVATPNRKRLINRLLNIIGREPVLSDPQHFREYTNKEIKEIGENINLVWRHGFGYELSLTLPKLQWQVIPHRFAIKLGNLMPAIADAHCTIFRKPSVYTF